MNEIRLGENGSLRAEKTGAVITITGIGPDGNQTLLETTRAAYRAERPYFFIDAGENLWLFYTSLHGADPDTAQPMYLFAPKGHYAFDAVRWTDDDAIYPRLGGSFTNERSSPGVNEQEDTFSPELCRRYGEVRRALQGTPIFSDEEFDKYTEEKRLLALGKLYGVHISGNNYPYARRAGFSLRGAPVETRYRGQKALILPLYSNSFQCVLLLFSFDCGRTFDSREYLLCSLSPEDELQLKDNDGTLTVSIRTPEGILPAGKTVDLGKTWNVLYDYAGFKPRIDTVEACKPERPWRKQYGVKYLVKPSPTRFWRLAKTLATNERLFDFSKKVTADSPKKPHVPGVMRGLEAFEAPLIEDVFPVIDEHAHGSGIVCLHDGELLSVWFQSDGERKGNDGRILAARKPAGGTWQEPFVIADVAGMADCNPTVYMDANERLWFFWYPVLSNSWETSQPKYRYADKGRYEHANGYTAEPEWNGRGILNPGRTEQLQGPAVGVVDGRYEYGAFTGECRYITPEQFKAHPLPPREYVKIEERYITDPFVVALRNSMWDTVEFVRRDRRYACVTPAFELYLWHETERICRTAAGADSAYKKWRPITRWIGWQTKNKPIEFAYKGKTRLLIPLYSDGIHCSLTAYTDDGGDTWEYGLPFGSTAPEQAANVMKTDGTLRSYFRNGEPTGCIIYYESTDGGETYGSMRIEDALRHEGGFDIVKLADGTWVMSITDFVIGKGVRKHNRSRLRLAVSTDEGETWTASALEVDENGLTDYHYSAITQGPDGNIYVSYSHDDDRGKNNIRCATLKKADGNTQ